MTFHHEALLSRGEEESFGTTLGVLQKAIGDGVRVTMLAPSRRVEQIRHGLGAGSRRVRFHTVEELGRNPARLIPFWWEQLEESAAHDVPLLAVSEALVPDSSDALIEEFAINESLLNTAFERSPDWALFCPYDLAAHHPTTIESVRASHPFITENGHSGPNPAYRSTSPFEGSLPDPPIDRIEMPFSGSDLAHVRHTALTTAQSTGLGERAGDVAIVTSELATNSIRHGGGDGTLILWSTESTLVCEVRDRGRLSDPLVGRVRPYAQGEPGGAGLWIANWLSNLVQIRSAESGTAIRVSFDRDAL